MRDVGAQRAQVDVGDRAEGDDAAAGGGDREPREASRVVGGSDVQHHVRLAPGLDHAPDGQAAERAPDRTLDRGSGEAEAKEVVPPGSHPDAGRGERALCMDVDRARHPGEALAHRRGRLLERDQVRPAQPDDQRGARPFQGLLDALVQELLHVEGEAADGRRALPERLGDLRRVRLRPQADEQLAALGAEAVVLGESRAPEELRHRLDAGHAEERPFGRRADARRLAEADARRAGHVHDEVGLVELGQELEPQQGNERDAHDQGEDAPQQDPSWPVERTAERALVARAQREHAPRRLLVPGDGAGQEHEAEGRRHRERHHERGERGENVGERERPEERALEPAQQKDGKEHERHHDGRVDDGAAHLDRGGEDHVQRPRAGWGGAQTAPGILDVDDRIVHHLAHRDREAAEHHHVERRTDASEHHHGSEERERDGDDAHQRRAQVAEEEEQHDHDEHRAGEERAAQVAERVLDEARLAEERLVDMYARREDADDGTQRRLDALRDRHHVHLGLLRDHEQHAAIAVHDRVPDRHRGAVGHVGDRRDRDRPAVAAREQGPRDVIRAMHAPVEPGEQPLPRAVEEARAGGGIGGADGRGQVVERRTRREQTLRGRRHLDLPHAAAVDDHVGDAGNRKETRPNRPLRQVAQHERRDVRVAAQPDGEHPGEHGGERGHRRGDPARQLPPGERDSLDHELARAIRVRPVVEDRAHDAQPEGR